MVFKNKGDVQSCCNYGGIKLMNHIMKLWEKLLMFGYEERWWSMIRARASCWEITRQMFVFRVLLKYKEGQESYCLCGCIESLWWEGTVAPHEEITSSSEVWGQRDSGDVCSRNAKTMVWVRWETRDARKTQMLGFVWLSDSASFTVIQSVLTAEWHYVDRGENIHFICSSGNGSNISNICLAMCCRSCFWAHSCSWPWIVRGASPMGSGWPLVSQQAVLCFILDLWF